MHLTGGQPARGPELLSIRWRNSVYQDRNLYVINGQLATVTRYHKSQSLLDRPKVIPRFLPGPVGQLVAAYLLYLRPLQAILLSSQGKVLLASMNDYLWIDNEKRLWKTDRLTRILAQESAELLGTRLTVQDYRHIAIGIGRKIVGKRFEAGLYSKSSKHFKAGKENESDSNKEQDPIELQNARSTKAGTVAYAVRADIVRGLTARSIEVFGTVSCVWHAFLGFAPPMKQS